MKTTIAKVVVLMCVALCLVLTSLAAEKKSGGSAEDQIKSMLEQSRQAALKGDTSYLEQNAANDYVRVNPDGKVLSKIDMVNGLKSGDVKYQSIEPSDIKVRVFGSTAVATMTADVKGTNKGQDASGHYQVTRVFAKQGGKWQEVAFQSTKVAQ